MAFTLNTSVLRTPTGILKIVETVLVLIVLMVARFGKRDYHIFRPFNEDNSFLGQGISVGYAIIVPSVLVTYLLGANLSILEWFINLIGGLLFIIVGAVTIACWSKYLSSTNGYSAGMALGSICIITGIVFIIDFAFSIKNFRSK